MVVDLGGAAVDVGGALRSLFCEVTYDIGFSVVFEIDLLVVSIVFFMVLALECSLYSDDWGLNEL